MTEKARDETDKPRDLRGRYTKNALTFVEPLIAQALDMERMLQRLGEELRDAPFEVDTGCGTSKRNPLVSTYCELNKAYRMTIQQLMEAEDAPAEGGSWLDEMRLQAAAKRPQLMPSVETVKDDDAQSA